MISQATKKNWTRLCHDDPTDGYIVTTKEGDRFVFSFDDMVRACGHVENGRRFRAQFGEFFPELDSWLQARAAKLDRAYLSFDESGIQLTVILRARELDREFDDELISFDIQVAQDERFNLIRLHCLSLPFCSEDSVRSFVRDSGTMKRQFA